MPFRYVPKGNRTPVHDLATGLHFEYGRIYDDPTLAGREGFEEVKEESLSNDQESVAVEAQADESPQKRARTTRS